MQTVASYFIHDSNLTNESQTELYKHFGTFTRSFLSVMELTIGGWSSPIRKWADHIGDEHVPWLFSYALVLNFGLVKIISAVFLIQAFSAAGSDEELTVSKKASEACKLEGRLKSYFSRFAESSDESNDEWIDVTVFKTVVKNNPNLDLLLSSMDLDMNDLDVVFNFLSGGRKRITVEAFTRGIVRLKGT